MVAFPFSVGRLIARTHAMVAVTLLIVVVATMAGQVSRRSTFASTELHDDVMDRWGTPITQAAPSVRFVEHGAVFHELEPLPLSQQRVHVDAAMNYRKRGLVYFSGFDFSFHGDYAFVNDRPYPIDVAFVFPLDVERDRVLLSDLRFAVDGQDLNVTLQEGADRLLWTGRVEPQQAVQVVIAYRGRGLDAFRYVLDPALPVRGLDLTLAMKGGSNFDYPAGVVPATQVTAKGDQSVLGWRYDALEAGVPLGAVLPSEKGYDTIITTLIVRAWVPFALFFAGLVVLGIRHQYRLRVYETGLLVATYLFFYVLLPYLAAFVHFYVAYGVALVLCGGLITAYLARLMGRRAVPAALALLSATLVTPTVAVLLEGYTGLLYTLEILVGLALLMLATTRPGFGEVLAGLAALARPLPPADPKPTAAVTPGGVS